MVRKAHAKRALPRYLVRRMSDSRARADRPRPLACYAPSVRYLHLAYSAYGVGHTAWRQPGDMRGTVVGKKGRFRHLSETKGGDD